MSDHLFIAGVPCTGKSLFGDWLGKQRGWIHIDAERKHGADFDAAGIHAEWDQFLSTGRANIFSNAADRTGKRVVLNWGFPLFPTSYAFIVPALQTANFSAWWFRGDRIAAKDAFIKRGGIPIALFEGQMDQIERQDELIKRLFGDQTIEALKPDGSQRQPEDLWQELTARDKRLIS